jgi:hypothetical protein
MTVKRATMARFRSIADAIPASVPAGESEVPAAIEATMIGRARSEASNAKLPRVPPSA